MFARDKKGKVIRAPCRINGEVHETDHDTKDGICKCRAWICLVDRQNRVVHFHFKQRKTDRVQELFGQEVEHLTPKPLIKI